MSVRIRLVNNLGPQGQEGADYVDATNINLLSDFDTVAAAAKAGSGFLAVTITKPNVGTGQPATESLRVQLSDISTVTQI